MTDTINPFKALDFIRDNAEAYAQAKDYHEAAAALKAYDKENK
jgi:hypothetical protein